MINTLQSHKLLFRDGTSQQDRYHEPLQPEYVQIEGRSMEDLIAEAQRLAKELQFFDEQHNPVANWESFLIDDAAAYHKKSETGKEIQRKQWAAQLAAYVEAPDRFLDNEKTLARLSRPHLVLFMTFLKLLNHVKSQINRLTKKHLDFYFRERLGLTPKGAVPDVVNVLLDLAKNINRLEVKKGTVLFAGEDEEGNELHYTTDEDTIISHAQIAQLKNVFVDKQIITIKKAHLNNIDAPDGGFSGMMEMALGDPDPGDPLPPLPGGVEDLPALNALVQQENAEAEAYLEQQLFLLPEDFDFIIQRHLDDMNGEAVDWQKVYDRLDQAYKNKFKAKRQQALRELHENEGFDTLLKEVYGSPLPGDDLPLYRGAEASFAIVYNDLSGTDPNAAQDATAYILEELKLTGQEFVFIIQTSGNEAADEKDQEEMYRLLELAGRKVRSISLPSPALEKLIDVYAAPDAIATGFSQYGDEDESMRFKTFGSKPPGVTQALQPAHLGFAVSSPALLLKEGQRQITALVDFGAESSEVETLQSVFHQDTFTPFQVYLSSEDQWFQPENVTFAFGDHLGIASEGTYEGTLTNQTFTVSAGDDLTGSDIGKYLVFPNGVIYEITTVNTQTEAMVIEAGNTASPPGDILKFASAQVYLNALKVVIDLSEDDLPVVPFGAAGEVQYIRSEQPALVFSLHHILEEQQGEEIYLSHYQSLMNLSLNKVQLMAAVKGIKNLTLQNDQSSIDAKKPFEPFGFEPGIGTSFYLTHEELSYKKLHSLELDVQWVKQPENFTEYYENYWLIEANDPSLDPSLYTINDTNTFKANVFLHDKNSEVPVTDVPLFPDAATGEKIVISDLPALIQQNTPAYTYKQNPNAVVGEEEAVDWDRYFRLELDPLDFQHTVYNTLFNRQTLSDDQAIKDLAINLPYQPKLKSLQAGYVAYTDIYPGEAGATSHDILYHIHPFGFKQLHDTLPDLLPAYQHQGTLYLGISGLEKPQILSVLFQMAPGSADPDVEKPEVQWSYLRNNEWITLEKSAVLSDTTNGLINTGIVRIKVPADATDGGSLMPGSLSWLNVSAPANIAGISDTVAVMAQAVSATLSSETVAPSHFENPLKAETITETLEPIPEIESITQPFTSLKGKPAEEGSALYKRLSERLRHKNRALTMWDYEHMVLNAFPQVYKAKCLPSGDELGRVDVIVIPDIRGSRPFTPFSPKVAADTLFQIREYLNNYSPAYANVEVINPFYLQVKTRCTVKFYPGYDEEFYKAKLIDEIKRFLSPWAYDEGNDIRIGGTLHASLLINFIAERPYIDYVAHLKLFQSEDGKKFTDVRTLNEGKTIVVPDRPDMILVSAQSHIIDVVDESGYDEDNFKGINYMKIQTDFQIGEDLT